MTTRLFSRIFAVLLSFFRIDRSSAQTAPLLNAFFMLESSRSVSNFGFIHRGADSKTCITCLQVGLPDIDRNRGQLFTPSPQGAGLGVGVVRFSPSAAVLHRLTENFAALAGILALLPTVTSAFAAAWPWHRSSSADEAATCKGLTCVMSLETLGRRTNVQTV